jgi:hypothetical protein
VAKNGKQWYKMGKMVKNGKNGKMVKNGKNGHNLSTNVNWIIYV